MLLKEFRDLRSKHDKLLGLPDQLNYAIPIDDFTIALKDGAFLSAFECSGLDLNSASTEELDAHRAQGNRALARLDDGFMYNADLIRHPSVEYASRTFPNPVSAALDREREIQYSAEGQHFETRCVLTITYRPPGDAQTRIGNVFLSGTAKRSDWRRQLSWFEQKLREFEDAISPVWKLTALEMPDLLSHLASCINGRMCEIAVPSTPTYLDAIVGNQDLIAGFKPRIGGRHLRVVALSGFPPFSFSETAGPGNPGRTQNGDQPADRLPAQLVSEAAWVARHHQRALRLRRWRSISKSACTQNGRGRRPGDHGGRGWCHPILLRHAQSDHHRGPR
jgi:type IV secretion system protein TrbE